jgi:hypothetical protein
MDNTLCFTNQADDASNSVTVKYPKPAVPKISLAGDTGL